MDNFDLGCTGSGDRRRPCDIEQAIVHAVAALQKGLSAADEARRPHIQAKISAYSRWLDNPPDPFHRHQLRLQIERSMLDCGVRTELARKLAAKISQASMRALSYANNSRVRVAVRLTAFSARTGPAKLILPTECLYL
jgi:hypothetical protein